MPKLFLVRHGESAWNAEGRLQGQADPPLSDARPRAGARAAPAARCRAVGSDLLRARETAALAGFPDAPTDPRWRERGLGEWETLLEAEVTTREDMARFRAGELVPPGGEAWPDFQARVAEAAAELEERLRSSSPTAAACARWSPTSPARTTGPLPDPPTRA